MGKRKCLSRGTPKTGRKKGRCLKWARPAHSKKTSVPRSLKTVERKSRKTTRKRRCLVRNAEGQCKKWAKTGVRNKPSTKTKG